LKVERLANLSIPRKTASQVSCTTSSAIAGLPHERGGKLQHGRVMARRELDEGLLVASTQARN
jgi:hypothetical protein